MEVVYGINSIVELLRRQKSDLKKIIIASGRTGASLKEIITLAREKVIPVEFNKRRYLDELAGTSAHQGIIALCKPFAYADIDEILKNRCQSFKFDLILVLDSIMDPQNLGSIIRTAYCFGANGIIIPEDRAASVTPIVYKTSAGSVTQIPIARVINISQAIDYLKDKGFWVFGAEARGGTNLYEMDFNCSVVLVLGGEAKGIRSLVKKKCDFLLTIPILGNFDSLNVAVASGVILYEIFCQRRCK